jgi:hypothetical protein
MARTAACLKIKRFNELLHWRVGFLFLVDQIGSIDDDDDDTSTTTSISLLLEGRERALSVRAYLRVAAACCCCCCGWYQ